MSYRKTYKKDTEPVKKGQLFTNKHSIVGDQPNSINVTNTEEQYKAYFRFGGTVRQMTPASAKTYMKYKKNKREDSKK